MDEEQEFEIKNTKSDLANAIKFYLPLIEEITEAGFTPMCVIGIKIKEEDDKRCLSYFATHNKTMDEMLYGICKSFVEGYENNKLTFL